MSNVKVKKLLDSAQKNNLNLARSAGFVYTT